MTQDELKMVLEFVESINLGSRSASVEQQRKVITAIEEALAQQEQEYDWKDLYEKEKRRSAMWLAKYEEVAGPAPKAYPLAQPEQEPIGFVQQSVSDWLYSKQRSSNAYTTTTIAKSPTETEDVAIYTTPPQRTEPVIDKSAAIRIATALGWKPKRTWVGLTEQEHTDIAVECGCMSADWVFYGAAVERKVKERNT